MTNTVDHTARSSALAFYLEPLPGSRRMARHPSHSGILITRHLHLPPGLPGLPCCPNQPPRTGLLGLPCCLLLQTPRTPCCLLQPPRRRLCPAAPCCPWAVWRATPSAARSLGARSARWVRVGLRVWVRVRVRAGVGVGVGVRVRVRVRVRVGPWARVRVSVRPARSTPASAPSTRGAAPSSLAMPPAPG